MLFPLKSSALAFYRMYFAILDLQLCVNPNCCISASQPCIQLKDPAGPGAFLSCWLVDISFKISRDCLCAAAAEHKLILSCPEFIRKKISLVKEHA